MTNTSNLLATTEQAHDEQLFSSSSIKTGTNDLLIALSPLFILNHFIRHESHKVDESFVARLEEELQRFKDKLISYEYDGLITHQATYMVALFFEQALSNKGHTCHQRFFKSLHLNYEGDEVFFTWLEKYIEKPNDCIELLELAYVLLSLGYWSSTEHNKMNHQTHLELRDRLYRNIKHHRGQYSRSLSLVKKYYPRLPQYRPSKSMLQTLLLSSALIIGAYTTFTLFLNQQSQTILSQITMVAKHTNNILKG